MKWFKHDSNANTDAKLRKLRLKYGMEGYGLYWYCLELIAQNVEKHNLTFELEHDAEIIAADTGIHFERIQEMMQDMVRLRLFENDAGAITCMKMAMRLDETTSKHPNIKQLQDSIRNNSRQSPDSLPTVSGESPARTEQNRTEQIRTEEKPLSGDARPPSPLREKNRITRGEAIEALRFLNEKTGKAYREVDANLKLIESILKSGVSLEDIRTVTMRKVRDWRDDPKMAQYLRPATLYRRSNFEQYLGELETSSNQFQGAI